MTKQVQRRRGTATQHTSFTGAEGELSVNTTNKSVHVHDNVTAGGFEAARVDMDNVTSSSILTAAGITATTTELNYVDGVTSAIQTQIDGKAGTASPTFTGTLTTANLTATGTTTLAGASTSADITFGDNDKAIFGAGSDLNIFHNGSSSLIQDSGTGGLTIRSNLLTVQNAAGNETVAQFVEDGFVKLFHNNSQVFTTTATGVDVTGVLSSDGLTVDGDGKFSGTVVDVNIIETDQTNLSTQLRQTAGQLRFRTVNNDLSAATERMRIDHATGDISFYEDTGTTPKFFWDASAESLGVGTSSPAFSSGYGGLHVHSTYPEVHLTGFHSGSGATDGFKIQKNSANDVYLWNYENAFMVFGTNNAEAMRIDSSRNVGIGVVPKTGGSTWQHVQFGGTGNLIARKDDSAVDAMFASNYYVNSSNVDSYTTTGAAARMFLNDSTISFDQAASGTAGSAISWSEAMRIDSSGNLLVGTTTTDTATVTGVTFQPDGQIFAGASNQQVATFSRQNSDGEIVRLRKGSTTVGSIGTQNGSDFYIGSSPATTGLRFQTNEIVPVSATGANKDGAIDVGKSNIRFKDLYLSGGVYLGGTGSANKLDDYEEGTWTPTLLFGGASVGMVYGQRNGYYTKVGNMVTASCYIYLSAKGTSTGGARLYGLPFTSNSATNSYTTGTFWVNTVTFTGYPEGYIDPNSTNFSLAYVAESGAATGMTNGNFSNGSSLMINVAYRV